MVVRMIVTDIVSICQRHSNVSTQCVCALIELDVFLLRVDLE